METALTRIRTAINEGRNCFFSTPNLNFLVGCLSDHDFRQSVVHSNLCVADGMPIIWIAKALGIPLYERVAGSTLFEHLKKVTGIAIYFFGGMEGTAKLACQKINGAGEGMVCVGAYYPGMGAVASMSSEEIINQINSSDANFVVVSLGAKKGQAWIEHNRHRLMAPAVSHLGAVVNFVAGTVSRAPLWMQRVGLEWLWRIKEEPSLWQRYALDGKAFLLLIVKHVIPLVWVRVRYALAKHDSQSGSIETHELENEFIISLAGDWVRGNLSPLRDCFSNASKSDKDVRIVMTRVTHIDSAFLGLLQLLDGVQTSRQRRLSLTGLQTQTERFFRYSCVGYLLSDSLGKENSI
jgi:N-acetylglucosaminyldiphosphoundecaprenol N-acetyl-beta-D-mannosaminyltransferase